MQNFASLASVTLVKIVKPIQEKRKRVYHNSKSSAPPTPPLSHPPHTCFDRQLPSPHMTASQRAGKSPPLHAPLPLLPLYPSTTPLPLCPCSPHSPSPLHSCYDCQLPPLPPPQPTHMTASQRAGRKPKGGQAQKITAAKITDPKITNAKTTRHNFTDAIGDDAKG